MSFQEASSLANNKILIEQNFNLESNCLSFFFKKKKIEEQSTKIQRPQEIDKVEMTKFRSESELIFLYLDPQKICGWMQVISA